MFDFIPGETGSRLSAFELSQTRQIALLGSCMSPLGTSSSPVIGWQHCLLREAMGESVSP